jgi:hypothetical protein
MSASCPIGIRELARRQRRLREYIGEQIRALRIEAAISQAGLARACGRRGLGGPVVV